MHPQHIPELTGKTPYPTKDASTLNKALKYFAIAAIIICTVAVSALFVKVYVLKAEPFTSCIHNEVGPIKEDKEPIHKEQDEVFVVDLNLEFEPPTIPYEPPTVPYEPPTIPYEPPTVPYEPPTIPYESINQESFEDKNNNLKKKHIKSHVFQSIIPGNVMTDYTNDVEIVKPSEKSHIKNDTYHNQHPFSKLFSSFNLTDEKEQTINNESRKNDDDFFENLLDFLSKPIFDFEETNFSAISPINNSFKPIETWFYFPSYNSTFNSNEEMFPLIDSVNEGENIFHFPKPFFDSEK